MLPALPLGLTVVKVGLSWSVTGPFVFGAQRPCGRASPVRKRKHTKQWLFFVAAAVVLHFLLVLYIKPSFFVLFNKSPEIATETSTRGRIHPDAILYIPIEIEENEEKPTERISEESDIEKPIDPTDRQTFPKPQRPAKNHVNIEDFLGESSQTLPQAPGTAVVKIPPRPLEITWPDTRDLRHCLGHHIDVRIQVGENGKILQLQPEEGDYPADCLSAALDSARRIVFAPGQINGRPVRMWTHIRIDFQRMGK